MKCMNGYIIVKEASSDSRIEMPEQLAQSVRKGIVVLTSEEADDFLAVNDPQATEGKEVMIYYRAAEGLAMPDETIAIPMKAVIAID